MFLAHVNRVEIELVVTNERVLEESLVHQLDLNLALLEAFHFHVLRLEEDMLVPDGETDVVNVIKCFGKFAFSQTVDFNDGIDDFAFGNI